MSDEAEVATTAKKCVPNAGSLESRDEARPRKQQQLRKVCLMLEV